MKETVLAGGGEGPVTLITDGAFGLVDADDRNADRVPASVLELHYLVPKIVDHPVNLLNHCLRQDLHLHADLDGGDWASRHRVAGVDDRSLAGNDFAKRPIATPGGDTTALILDAQNPIPAGGGRLDQSRRAIHADQVFVEVHRNEVALSRITMSVDLAFKQPPEFRGEPVFDWVQRLRQG